MSEETQNEEVAAEETAAPQEEGTEEQASAQPEELKLNGLFAFKEGMTSVYGDQGEAIPVTVLKYEPMVVSQVKTQDNDGYEAIQVACKPKRATRTPKSEKNHLAKAGFENGAYVTREVRQSLPEGIELGQKVSINSLAAGDKLAVTSKSKGRGFAGAMKRHGFGGGPASHGSGFHRRPGSIGNCEFPGRVMPGRKMPGHYGDAVTTVKNVEVVRVLPEENVILVKGPVPGARNNLVQLVRL